MTIAHRVSAFNRERKWKVFMAWAKPTPETRFLDVGYSNVEYSPSDNYVEKHYPYKKQIVALGVEECDLFQKKYPDVVAVKYDGHTFPFADDAFDISYSNAVIEHVGDFDAQVQFIREHCRVSSRVFMTTPNRWFPIEVHTRLPFVHWLPDTVRDAFFRLCGKSWATGSYMQLLSERMLRKALQEAGVTRYTILKNRFFGLAINFVVIVDRAA